ncbi:MAG: hypothetical protein H9928_12825 [Candidatus Phocaeicola excrementipullorum]|uniref:Uncharacterized protein n=1 Tax=Candidatus Phocaeicola excrementipullorum TaxID=2838731 RepID=A0A948TQF5_9BACT|nr:hypothetical protein [Candidatus Phocaeicola excrementipullorum]
MREFLLLNISNIRNEGQKYGYGEIGIKTTDSYLNKIVYNGNSLSLYLVRGTLSKTYDKSKKRYAHRVFGNIGNFQIARLDGIVGSRFHYIVTF